MMILFYMLVFPIFIGCKYGVDSPETLAKEVLSSVGDSQKMLSLMPTTSQLQTMMTCSSENDLLGRLSKQRARFEAIKDQKPGFKLRYRSAEVTEKKQIAKGDVIPDSLSKCTALKPLVFTEIKGLSYLIDAQTKTDKETTFTAVQLDGRWLLFLLKTNHSVK